MNNHYDVVIVGGRCAGSSLAIRLAHQNPNLKIALLDRATFPSLPAVPSSPILHPGAMSLMDELGIPESEYADPGGKADHYVLEFVGYFSAIMPTSRMQLDRSYVYGLDRNKFDCTLWTHAERNASVAARANFGVMRVLKNGSGEITGIVGKSPKSREETFTADLVVGADGRYSLIAREVGAKTVEERNDYAMAAFHAEWENVDPYSDQQPQAITFYNVGVGKAVLAIPIAPRKYIISNYMHSKVATFGGQNLEEHYIKSLQSVPSIWRRLAQAKRVTPIVGVRRIENGYREAYGKGWALVGDALHYKDPLDGQGIYDALIESKFLAEEIVKWKNNGCTWMEAGAAYHKRAMDATYAMFDQTVARVQREMHTSPPPFIIKTLIRWMVTDPAYQSQFLRYISRAIDPKDYKASPNPRILLRGLGRDIKKRLNLGQPM